MSYGVLECDSYVRELHAYDFAIKHFVIKRGVICAGPSSFFPPPQFFSWCYWNPYLKDRLSNSSLFCSS